MGALKQLVLFFYLTVSNELFTYGLLNQLGFPAHKIGYAKQNGVIYPATETVATVDPSAITEAEGWDLQVAENASDKNRILLSRSANSRACLESCLNDNSGCRFVSYNLDNKQCTGFKIGTQGKIVPSVSATLLALSNKRFFYLKEISLYPEDGQWLAAYDGGLVANDGIIFSEDLCLLLCRIHPRCNGLTYIDYKCCSPKANGTTVPVGVCFMGSKFGAGGLYYEGYNSYVS